MDERAPKRLRFSNGVGVGLQSFGNSNKSKGPNISGRSMNFLSCQSDRSVSEDAGAKIEAFSQSPGARSQRRQPRHNVHIQNGVESDTDEETSSSSDASTGSFDIEGDCPLSSDETSTESSEASSSNNDSQSSEDGSRPPRLGKADLGFDANSYTGLPSKAAKLIESAMRQSTGNREDGESLKRSFSQNKDDDELADRHNSLAAPAKIKKLEFPRYATKRSRSSSREITYVQEGMINSQEPRSLRKRARKEEPDSGRSRISTAKPATSSPQREIGQAWHTHRKPTTSSTRGAAVKQKGNRPEPSDENSEERLHGSPSSTSEPNDPKYISTQLQGKERNPASSSPSTQSSRSTSPSRFPSYASAITSLPLPKPHRKEPLPSDLRQRLASFLPQLKSANAALNPIETAQLDRVDEGEEHYIEMDLGLGVLEGEKDKGKSIDGIKIQEGSESENESSSTESDGEDDKHTNTRTAMDALMRRKGSLREKPVVQEVVD